MGLQKYITLSIFYIITIGGFAYYLNQGLYPVVIWEYTIETYVALLVIAPIIIFLILSTIHMLIYGLKNYIKEKNDKKDINKFSDHLKALILGKKSTEVFSNKNLQDIADFLQYMQLEYSIDKSYKTNIEKLDEVLKAMKDIHSGIYVEKLSKKFELEKTNELYIKNTLNRFDHDNKFYLDVLKNQANHKKDIIEFAFLIAIGHENFDIIKKEISNIDISEQAVIKLFKLYENKDNELQDDDYINIAKKANLSQEQYIRLIKALRNSINPDKLMLLMDKICDKEEHAIKAYIYLLLDLELIDKAKELLQDVDTQDGEYIKFKTYLSAKDSGAKCSISDFI